MGFLDNTGLATVWQKILDKMPTKTSELTNDSGFLTDTGVYGIYYGTCTTAGGTAAKVATLANSSGFSLTKGVTVAIKFSNANTVASPTLAVAGTTAKSIKRYGTTAPSTSAASSWNAGSVVVLVYDGSYWQMVGWVNSTYSEISAANITNGSGSTTGLVTGRRAKAAVEAFAPVTSVNGSTGAVTISVPTKTSDLTNDSGFITNAGVTSFNGSTGAVTYTAPVTSVNGDTGDVTVSVPTLLEGSTSIITPSQVLTALQNGDPIHISHIHPTYGIIEAYSFNYSDAFMELVSNIIAVYNGAYMLFELHGNTATDTWSVEVTQLAQSSDIPTVPTNVSAFNNDAGYLTSSNAVPTSRTVNSKALSSDIDLYATDIYLSSSKQKTVSAQLLDVANVQADWNETDSTSDAYILNKPTIPAGVDKYITNQGTYGSYWVYRVWSNGFQEVWYHGSVTFSSASSTINGWQRATQNVSIPISNMTGVTAFSDNAVAMVSGAYAGRVFTTGGIKTNGTQFEAMQLGGASMAAATVSGWNVYISGYQRT